MSHSYNYKNSKYIFPIIYFRSFLGVFKIDASSESPSRSEKPEKQAHMLHISPEQNQPPRTHTGAFD